MREIAQAPHEVAAKRARYSVFCILGNQPIRFPGGCPSARGCSAGLLLSKPTSTKARATKTFNNGRTFADRFPNQLRGVVFDHKDNRALIQTEDPWRYPAIRIPAFFRIGGIKTGVEPIGTYAVSNPGVRWHDVEFPQQLGVRREAKRRLPKARSYRHPGQAERPVRHIRKILSLCRPT